MALAETYDGDLIEADGVRVVGLGGVLAEPAFGWAVMSLAEMPVAEQVRLCGVFRRELDRVETLALAAAVAVDEQAGRRLLDTVGSTKRDVRLRTQRAKTVAENPVLAGRVAAGGLSGEQLDVVAKGIERSDGAVAEDPVLLDRVAAAGPEQGRKIMKRWIDARRSGEDVDREYRRHRRLRLARCYENADGLGAILLEGDRPTITATWADIVADADRMYSDAGGRDVPAGSHRLTHAQRLFDAAINRLSGATPRSSETGAGSGSRRAGVVVTVELEKLLGDDPDARAEQIGAGPIADEVLAGWIEKAAVGDADLVGAVFHRGRPLWMGHNVRNATVAQVLSLTVRDKGCVLCPVGHNKCQAHHLIPVNAPARGPTDVDAMALLCPACHRWLHINELTLYQDTDGVWKTRSATPEEIPQPHSGSRPSGPMPRAAQRETRHDPKRNMPQLE